MVLEIASLYLNVLMSGAIALGYGVLMSVCIFLIALFLYATVAVVDFTIETIGYKSENK